MTHNIKLLDDIGVGCTEIQGALKAHLSTTSNAQYKADIEIDVITLDNLKQILKSVKNDIESDNIGSSTELLLRIAANDFKNKLKMIPEKKNTRKEIIHALKDLHKNILGLTFRRERCSVKQNRSDQERAALLNHTIIHTALDGFWVADLHSKFIEVSDSYCDLTGYSRDELLTMSICDIEAMKSAEEIQQHINLLMQDGHLRFESQHRCKNGRIIDVDITVTYLRGYSQFCSFMRDITKNKQQEIRLKESEKLWQQTFDLVPNPISVIAPDHSVIKANKAFSDYAGRDYGSYIGEKCYTLIHGEEEPPSDCPLHYTLKELKSGFANIFEPRRKKHLQISTTPQFSEQGKLIHVVHVMTDITERIQLETKLLETISDVESKISLRTAELVQAHEQAKKMAFELVWAEELERERIAGELHDQVGQTLMLAKLKLDELKAEIPTDVLSINASEVSRLLGNAIAEIRSLTFKMRPPILDTASIDASLEFLCHSITHDYGVQIDFTTDKRRKPLSAVIKYALYQSIREILMNVVKHAKSTKNILKLSTTKDVLTITITDNGVGFDYPPAVNSELHKNSYGIYNVQHKIEQLGGKFSVKTSPGNGTTIGITFLLNEIVQKDAP